MLIADTNFDRVQARNGLTAKNQSQMSKIIPMLQIGSKKNPEPEVVLKKQEQRVKELEELADGFHEATRRLFHMFEASSPHQLIARTRQLKRLTDALKFINEAKANKLPHGTTKAARACINELTSLREACFLDELTPELIDLSSTQAFEVLVRQLLDQARIVLSKCGTEPEDSGRDPVFGTEVAAIIADTASRSVLPDLREKPYTICRVPVVAVGKSGISMEILKNRGFPVISLCGYPALNNQLILGINPKELELTDKEKAEGLSIPRSRWFEVADRVRIQIRKETKQRIAFVDERPYGFAGGAWFWLMLEDQLQDFTSAFPGKSLQLRNWGFANASK